MLLPLISDARFNSIALVLIAVIGGAATLLTAYWSHGAKKNSEETAAQVRTNGGMSDPEPNVNDHIKYQTKMLERLTERQDNHEQLLADHISHSRIMYRARADVYLAVKPTARLRFILDEEKETD